MGLLINPNNNSLASHVSHKRGEWLKSCTREQRLDAFLSSMHSSSLLLQDVERRGRPGEEEEKEASHRNSSRSNFLNSTFLLSKMVFSTL